MRDLIFSQAEHPIVAQFFTSSPEMIAYVARLAEELGFDGVDINMGCPDRSIEKQGAGAAMIRTPEKALAGHCGSKSRDQAPDFNKNAHRL
jgi:tRNA-dihydrouridine synthase B